MRAGGAGGWPAAAAGRASPALAAPVPTWLIKQRRRPGPPFLRGGGDPTGECPSAPPAPARLPFKFLCGGGVSPPRIPFLSG